MRLKWLSLTLSLCLSFSAFASTPLTNAQISAKTQPTSTPKAPLIIPPPPTLNAKGYVLMDAKTGTIIAQKNMNTRMAPASLTKLMSLYIVFDALKSGQIQLSNKVLISKKAWETGGSRMFVRVGTDVSVQKLIEGVIVDSGNDAVTALSQFVGGTEATFVQMMNETAKKLHMTGSHFVDATGLPVPNHYTTPHDLALLTRAIIRDFPSYYHFFDEKWLSYDHIRQPNRNRLLWWDNWVDGLKTGHTKEAGYCLITSGKQKNTRLISVVMGTPTDMARAQDSQALLDYGFRFFNTYKLYAANTPIVTPRIPLGAFAKTPMGITKSLYVTTPRGDYGKLKANVTYQKNLQAPLKKGQTYATLTVTLQGKPVASAALIALSSNPEAGLWKRSTEKLATFFHKLF